MGIPVVSTNAGGAVETFIDGESGFLVEDQTVTNLSDAVVSIINDNHFQKSAAKIARHHVEEHFSLATMHSQLEHILFEGQS
jgi:glycosyltransferase involved in cell wall biosynthesis